MKKVIIATIVSLFAMLQASAQYIPVQYPPMQPAQPAWSPDMSFSDIRMGIGLRVPLGNSSLAAGTCYDFSYGSFSPSGAGWRMGMTYMPENMNVAGHIGFPIAFAYRSGLRNTSLLDAGLNVAGGAIYDGVYGRTPTTESMLMDFLYGLFSRNELTVGLTPGYINGECTSEGVELKNRFFVSIDAEYSIIWRLWRFNFSVAPGIHYYLTNNFREYEEYLQEGYTVREVSSLRWQFSLCAALGFSF